LDEGLQAMLLLGFNKDEVVDVSIRVLNSDELLLGALVGMLSMIMYMLMIHGMFCKDYKLPASDRLFLKGRTFKLLLSFDEKYTLGMFVGAKLGGIHGR
jgi:hypothetical protein